MIDTERRHLFILNEKGLSVETFPALIRSWYEKITSDPQVELDPLPPTLRTETFYTSDLSNVTAPSSWRTEPGTITVCEGVTGLADGCFWGFNLVTTIIVPNALNSIGELAFAGCINLTNLDLTNVNGNCTLGGGAFYNCSSLTSLHLLSTELLPSTSGKGMCEGCTSLTTISFPERSMGSPYIGPRAFYNCVSFAPSEIQARYIGEYAFGNCTGLTNLRIAGPDLSWINNLNPTSTLISTINPNAFDHCTNLLTLTIDNIYMICGSAFNYCTNLEVVWLGNCVELYSNIFSMCSNITDLYLGNINHPHHDLYKNYSGSSSTLNGCSSLTNIYLGLTDSYHQSLGVLHRLTGTESPFKFSDSDEKIVYFTSTGIGGQIKYTLARTIAVEESITTLPKWLSGWTYLDTVTLPSTLQTIVDDAFSGTPLQEVTCLATTPPTITQSFVFGAIATQGSTGMEHIYVPAESVEAYQQASGWSDYASIIEAIPEVEPVTA